MFFSATLDGAGRRARPRVHDEPARYEGTLTLEHEQGEIDHKFVSVTADNKVETLAELLAEERGLALVFVRTKRGADRLVQKLARHNVTATAMHGDLNQNQRERALKRFESGAVSTLVATDVAARGLDLDDITHVINFDPPEDTRATSTASAAPAAPAATAPASRSSSRSSRPTSAMSPACSAQSDEFASEGMKVAPPRLVYASKRRNSKWGPSRPRRKI